jgi:hypothetical protein
MNRLINRIVLPPIFKQYPKYQVANTLIYEKVQREFHFLKTLGLKLLPAMRTLIISFWLDIS